MRGFSLTSLNLLSREVKKKTECATKALLCKHGNQKGLSTLYSSDLEPGGAEWEMPEKHSINWKSGQTAESSDSMAPNTRPYLVHRILNFDTI